MIWGVLVVGCINKAYHIGCKNVSYIVSGKFHEGLCNEW